MALNREKLMFDASNWNRVRYAVWAPFYDVLVGMLEEKRRRSIELAALQPGEQVLMLGAGTGLDLEYIAPGPRITAIDITPAMISRLRKRASRLKLDVEARVMDGQQLEFPDASFDVVILHFVLAVMPDPARALREVSRVLRPDGRVIVLNKFVPDDRQPSFLSRLLNPLVRIVATDLTCKLGPLLAASDLRIRYQELTGFRGCFKIAILKKEPAAQAHTPPPSASPSPALDGMELHARPPLAGFAQSGAPNCLHEP